MQHQSGHYGTRFLVSVPRCALRLLGQKVVPALNLWLFPEWYTAQQVAHREFSAKAFWKSGVTPLRQILTVFQREGGGVSALYPQLTDGQTET